MNASPRDTEIWIFSLQTGSVVDATGAGLEGIDPTSQAARPKTKQNKIRKEALLLTICHISFSTNLIDGEFFKGPTGVLTSELWNFTLSVHSSFSKTGRPGPCWLQNLGEGGQRESPEINDPRSMGQWSGLGWIFFLLQMNSHWVGCSLVLNQHVITITIHTRNNPCNNAYILLREY